MKKIIKVFSLIIFMFCLSGCLKEDKLKNDNVYTTIYPIKYLTNYLYGENKSVSSIYPNGADISTYELTKKQKETYSEGALFVYNGLTTEIELAREFLNDNQDILLIDVTEEIEKENIGSIEELWLSPNYYLKLAKNIKNYLIDYTTSKVVSESIEAKYKELEETLSYMDADLRGIASTAKNDGNPILIVSSSKLKFLENYGFEVITLDSESINPATIKSNFKNEKHKDIYLCNTDTKSELITELESNYKANVITVNIMYTLTDKETANNESYETIMNSFIENIRNTALS